jgi:hypothetical protein
MQSRPLAAFSHPNGANMQKAFCAVLLLTLAACGSTPPVTTESDCQRYGRASMQCQVEMYSKAGQ